MFPLASNGLGKQVTGNKSKKKKKKKKKKKNAETWDNVKIMRQCFDKIAVE